MGYEEMTTLTIRIPVTVKLAVQAEAVRRDRTISQQVVHSLRPYLSQTDEVHLQPA